jgi:hypothetical protein
MDLEENILCPKKRNKLIKKSYLVRKWKSTRPLDQANPTLRFCDECDLLQYKKLGECLQKKYLFLQITMRVY